MDPLTSIEDIKDTEKTKISVVYHKELKTSCILRICKNRDLCAVYNSLRGVQNLNTVFVYDFVYENGDTYILEECVSGTTVQENLEQNGTMSEQDTAQIIIEICKALEVLHNQKLPIVHNDINPSNIKIREDGSVKLFDFDISRTYKKGQSQNTELFGTEEYAAPEHFGYGQSEPRTDIYCLGVTMHKMLTGQGLSTEHRVTYSGKLKKIIKKCLEFDPKNRYNSVLELKKDLERFLSRERFIFRNVLWTIGVVTIMVGALLLYNAFGNNDTHNQTNDSGSSTTQTDNNNGNESVGGGDSTDSEIESGFNQDSNNESPNNQENTETEQPNNSRETAKAIPFAQKQSGVVNDTTAKWYKFATEDKLCAYRIELFYTGLDYTYASFGVAIYNSIGIQTETFSVSATYEHEYGFLDIYLDQNSEYFIKVYLENGYDTNYDICVTALDVDAGIDKPNATEIVLGSMHTATINSTLSDWYVFRVPETGKYTYTIHNIDVGQNIYFSVGNGTSFLVSNEENYWNWIDANNPLSEGDCIYFEVCAHKPDANGTYIIVIEKRD